MFKTAIKDRQEFNNEIDMLKGNINRMCVTDDFDELLKMKMFADKRIERICDYRLKQMSQNNSK